MAHMFDPPTILPLERVEAKLTNWLVCSDALKTSTRDEVASMLYHEFMGQARDQMLERLTARYSVMEKERLRNGMKVQLTKKNKQETEFDVGI